LVERIVSVSMENQEKRVQTAYLGLESDRNRLVSPVPLRVQSSPSSFSFPAQGNSSLAARGRGSSSPARTGERVPRYGLQVWSLDEKEDVSVPTVWDTHNQR
jgi:hypothetical protein